MVFLFKDMQYTLLLFQFPLFHGLEPFAHIREVVLRILQLSSWNLHDLTGLQKLDKQRFGMRAKGMFSSREVIIRSNQPMDELFAGVGDAISRHQSLEQEAPIIMTLEGS